MSKELSKPIIASINISKVYNGYILRTYNIAHCLVEEYVLKDHDVILSLKDIFNGKL